MHGSRADLARISAALDRDPFADPVEIMGAAMPRHEARRIERTLAARFRISAKITPQRERICDALPG